MRTKLNQLLALFFIAATGMTMSHNAEAGSLSFVPVTPTQNLSAGDSVSLQVWLDFSDVLDENGTPVGTIGGGFDINFDSEVLEYTGLDYIAIGDPNFGRPPDYYVFQPNQLQSWAMASFDGIIGPIMAGTVHFEVIADTAFVTDLSFGYTNSIDGSPFISAVDFSRLLDTEYGTITLTGVPLPGGVLLLMSALAVLRPPGAPPSRS